MSGSGEIKKAGTSIANAILLEPVENWSDCARTKIKLTKGYRPAGMSAYSASKPSSAVPAYKCATGRMSLLQISQAQVRRPSTEMLILQGRFLFCMSNLAKSKCDEDC